MKNRVFPTLAIVLSFTAAAGLSAQEGPTPPKPGEGHKVLAADVGVWDAVIKVYAQGPTAPPVEYRGVETVELVNGGLHSKSSFQGEMFGQKFEGHSLFGYDSRKKEYSGVWMDNFSEAPTLMKGTYDADTKKLTTSATVFSPEMGQEVKQKQVSTRTGKDTRKFELFMVIDAGGEKVEFKFLEIDYKRRAKK